MCVYVCVCVCVCVRARAHAHARGCIETQTHSVYICFVVSVNASGNIQRERTIDYTRLELLFSLYGFTGPFQNVSRIRQHDRSSPSSISAKILSDTSLKEIHRVRGNPPLILRIEKLITH